MNHTNAMKVESKNNFTCQRVPPERAIPSMLEEVRDGLLQRPRKLLPKYFYDSLGSQLFDRICDTPEYYVMRTEAELLEAHAQDIINIAQPNNIIELGSGGFAQNIIIAASL